MMYDFYKNQLANKTQSLTAQQSALFALYNCEKIIDMYQMIVNQYKVGDYFQIKSMSYYLWDNLMNYEKKKDFESQFTQMSNYVPNANTYPGVTNAIALNVVICLDVAFQCLTGHSNDANLSALYVYDTLRQVLLEKKPEIAYITEDVVREIDQTQIVLNLKEDELRVLENITGGMLDRDLIWSIFTTSQSKKFFYELIQWK